MKTAKRLIQEISTSLGLGDSSIDCLELVGEGDLYSAYAVTDLASAAIAAAAISLAQLVGRASRNIPAVTVDRRLSSLWFGWSIRPNGWNMPAVWDPIAGDYPTRDGWIRLHTNAPHHRKAVQQVLGGHGDKTDIARRVAIWSKGDLESAIVEAGGCAAEMRAASEWIEHPQGAAVAAEPLVHLSVSDRSTRTTWTPSPSRPLAGLRVLDLTRVLAGPVATRFLAGYGADVLRIDPYGWEERGIVPEVTLGKRCARLDLHERADRKQFEDLLSQCDILVHGYRPGALDNLGYASAQRRAFSPGLIDVSLSAYGWSGPWAKRRGFDSLVQMSSGIAHTGMEWMKADRPVPLPVQALDHATGYLIAATVVRAVERRLEQGIGTEAQLSLARTAKLLVDTASTGPRPPLKPESSEDLASPVENTDWGSARRIKFPVTIVGTDVQWTYPARELGSSVPAWQ
jgi:CoA-transferase family III